MPDALRLPLLLALLMPMGSTTTETEATVQQQVAQAASNRGVHEALSWLHLQQNAIEQWQMEMVAVPAPPFGEQKRAEWLKGKFAALGLQQVEIDSAGNVTGVLPGTGSAGRHADGEGRSLVAVTAHIDTVFPAGTSVEPRREGQRILAPGISDNGAGVSALLAMAAALLQAKIAPAAGILFVGNVGEEGEGDLRGMRYLFQQSRWKDQIGYTLVLDGTGNDAYVNQALGSVRLEVTVRGPGGHSWSDFGVPNPIVVLARAVSDCSRVELPEQPKTTFNFGVISGGTSVNSIPESASMRVDIRSGAHEQLDRLEKLLRECVEREVAAGNAGWRNPPRGAKPLSAEFRSIGNRPAGELPAEARMFQVLRAVDAHLGITSASRLASTDANIPLSLGREAISIGAGGNGGGAHTLHEWYEPTGRELGLKRILLALVTLAGSN